jgi:four helix bundle protein
VYQKARQVARAIFGISKLFPKDEAYSLTSQVRRSSRSIGAQITEAWAKRRYQNHFISKLTDADAEAQETQHWIETAEDCGYVDATRASQINGDLSEIGRMLNAMINKADSFCGDNALAVHESLSEYFALPKQ